MNVVLVSDTHGTVADNIVDIAQRADLVVHAGDIGCAAVLDLLRPVRGKLLAVTGNNDIPEKWPLGDQALLAALQSACLSICQGGYCQWSTAIVFMTLGDIMNSFDAGITVPARFSMATPMFVSLTWNHSRGYSTPVRRGIFVPKEGPRVYC